jgi:hypothetical protein
MNGKFKLPELQSDSKNKVSYADNINPLRTGIQGAMEGHQL